MDVVSSLVSLTVTKVLQFSGLADRNVLRTKKMEEKALEVYGMEEEEGGLPLT